MEDSYYSFAFKGLLTEEALDKSGRNNKMLDNSSLDEEILKRLPLELFDKDILNPSRRMATIYSALTAFENSVRKFLASKLMESYKEEWWTKGVSDKMRKKAQDRKTDEEKRKWHTQRGENLINYLDFGDLNSIIINNWGLFEPHLHAQEWVASILIPLEFSRNVLMHSGELDKEDVERIGTLIRDWFKQVGA